MGIICKHVPSKAFQDMFALVYTSMYGIWINHFYNMVES